MRALRVVSSSVRAIGGDLAAVVGHARLGVRRRDALRLELVAESGLSGVGECAPLPGFSPDDLASARPLLTDVHERLGAFEPSLAGIRDVVAPLGLRFAAAFALETALVDLAARSVGVSAHRFIGASASVVKARSGLVARLDESGRDDAMALARRHFLALKVKIGRADRRVDDELRFVRAVGAIIGPEARLTVDANGAFGLVDAPMIIAGAAHAGATLIEQPVAGAEVLDLGVEEIPFAVDEALVIDGVGERAVRHPGCGALVLKPALLGLLRALDLARLAADHGVSVIVSHLFDGPVGMAMACELALAVATAASGLDVHPGLAVLGGEPVPQLRTDARITPTGRVGLGFS